MYRANAAVELLGETSPGGGYIYRPALVELPADVAAGLDVDRQRLGQRRPGLPVGLPGRRGRDDDCLEVTGEVRYTSKQGQPGRTVTLQRTWCRDRGLVSATESFADLVTRTTQTATGPPRTPDTRGPLPRWTAPDSWTEHKLDTISIDPTFGQEPMSGTPKALAPVRTESGLVVRATASTQRPGRPHPQDPDRLGLRLASPRTRGRSSPCGRSAT